MKKFILLTILFLLLAAFSGFSQARPAAPGRPPIIAERDFGFGFIVGEPTGLSAKLWLGRAQAIDVTAAWSFVEESNFVLHIDYLYHLFNLFTIGGGGRMPFEIGLGSRLVFAETEPLIGLRAPVGVAYMFPTLPIELFVEVAPGMQVIPETEFNASGGFGLRYYF